MSARPSRTGAASLTIVYWRDIPAEILLRCGRERSRGELSPRFAAAIDRAAMGGQARDDDAYLAGWRRGDPRPVAGEPARAAQATAAEIEAAYPPERLDGLIRNGGHDHVA